jgi:protein TonB
MVESGPFRQASARRGGPVFFPARRRSLGWPALLFSLALHGAVMAAVAWGVFGGQGSDGKEGGMELVDEDAAPAPEFRALPKAEPKRPTVKLRPHKTFAPSNLPRVLAATQQAEIVVPKWDMVPSKPIEPSAPAPVAQENPPAPAQPVAAASAPGTGKATATKRKAVGKGSSTGLGDSLFAAQAPRIVSSFPPAYPYKAKRAGIEGTATVKVSVNESGGVAGCSIWASTGNAELDQAALKAVKGWRFTPAQRASSEVLVRVTFRLS